VFVFDFWMAVLHGRDMELRHLRTLEAIARHGSFTRAAEELHLAQSALSQQIRRLEGELGIQVLRRTSRRVDVTPEGSVVLAYARRVLAEVDGLQAELEELTGVVRGRVAIGAMWPTGNYDLAGTLATFHRRHAGVEIHMVEETADRLLEMLRADELDCAFASVDPDRLGDEFAATMLFEEQIVVAFAAGHPFGELEHVTFGQLAEQALIAYREGSELRRRLEWAMAAHDLKPRNAFLCTEMAAVRGLASRGLGVAVLPESIAHMEGEPIAFRPVGPEPLRWPVTIIWRAARRQPPAAKAFLALALDGVQRTEPPRLAVA
jgi:DNA-binding transcriptional LysR family regulator